jgi:hypothetical protein
MTVFRGVMIAHAVVVTDESVSSGWMGWMLAKMIPATIAAIPAARMRPAAVGCILLSFIAAFAAEFVLSLVAMVAIVLLPSY